MKKKFTISTTLKLLSLTTMLLCTTPIHADTTEKPVIQDNLVQDTEPTPVGLVKINGRTMYFQKDGTPLKNGKIKIDGYMYVFDKTGLLSQKYKYYKPRWIKKADRYYWQQDNGKILKKEAGILSITKSIFC